MFVEWGEDRFVVGGSYDDRDVRANWQGQEFGLRLLTDRRAVPSLFLRSPGVAGAGGTVDSIQHSVQP
jgi:hypothetical protein